MSMSVNVVRCHKTVTLPNVELDMFVAEKFDSCDRTRVRESSLLTSPVAAVKFPVPCLSGTEGPILILM